LVHVSEAAEEVFSTIKSIVIVGNVLGRYNRDDIEFPSANFRNCKEVVISPTIVNIFRENLFFENVGFVQVIGNFGVCAFEDVTEVRFRGNASGIGVRGATDSVFLVNDFDGYKLYLSGVIRRLYMNVFGDSDAHRNFGLSTRCPEDFTVDGIHVSCSSSLAETTVCEQFAEANLFCTIGIDSKYF
jgi:hypothetical protein